MAMLPSTMGNRDAKFEMIETTIGEPVATYRMTQRPAVATRA
jgi:uncharacterized membrane protein